LQFATFYGQKMNPSTSAGGGQYEYNIENSAGSRGANLDLRAYGSERRLDTAEGASLNGRNSQQQVIIEEEMGGGYSEEEEDDRQLN